VEIISQLWDEEEKEKCTMIFINLGEYFSVLCLSKSMLSVTSNDDDDGIDKKKWNEKFEILVTCRRENDERNLLWKGINEKCT
jgi:hypothetical protein